MPYSMISDISFLNPICKTKADFTGLYDKKIFEDEKVWNGFKLDKTIDGLINSINTPHKKRMSQLSLGIFYVLENGPGNNLGPEDEIYLFSGFGEIDTTDRIIRTIVEEKSDLVSPTLFHNSVHNTPLGYYTIIKGKHNYCATISDGLSTSLSFINFIRNRILLGQKFIIAAGEEYSPFLDLDETVKKDIVPAYISYSITPDTEKGFKFSGTADSLNELTGLDAYRKAENIFSDKDTFLLLKKTSGKKLFTDHPFSYGNPCGIISRLAMPFYLEMAGSSLVLEKNGDSYHLFEVNI